MEQPAGEIPAGPHNLAVARMEIHQWRNNRGELKKSSKESASHYHARLSCIQAVEPSFVGKSLLVPSDIVGLLLSIHKEHLQREFGLICHVNYIQQFVPVDILLIKIV